MTRLFARRKGRHALAPDTIGWGRLARYCEEASRHPVVEKAFTRARTSRPSLAPVPLVPSPLARTDHTYLYSPKDAA